MTIGWGLILLMIVVAVALAIILDIEGGMP